MSDACHTPLCAQVTRTDLFSPDMTKTTPIGKQFVQIMASALLYEYHVRRNKGDGSAVEDSESSESSDAPPPPPRARGGAGAKAPAAAAAPAAAPAKKRGAPSAAEKDEAAAAGLTVKQLRAQKVGAMEDLAAHMSGTHMHDDSDEPSVD